MLYHDLNASTLVFSIVDLIVGFSLYFVVLLNMAYAGTSIGTSCDAEHSGASGHFVLMEHISRHEGTICEPEPY